jgi:hypothetical protein
MRTRRGRGSVEGAVVSAGLSGGADRLAGTFTVDIQLGAFGVGNHTRFSDVKQLQLGTRLTI